MRFRVGHGYGPAAMRKAIPLLLPLLLVAAPAHASGWKSCGSSRDGQLLGAPDYAWATTGPFYVEMTRGTAADIARRVPPFEGYQESASEVPCVAASSVAGQAGDA